VNRSFIFGAVAAVGAVMLLPGVAAGLARAGRPLARAAVKTGAVAMEEFRKGGAEAFEAFEDLAAEVREEMAANQAREEAAERESDAGLKDPQPEGQAREA
jgi:hypothetical protein